MAFDKAARTREANRPRTSKARTFPSQQNIEAAGHEMKVNPPAVLAKTMAAKGKAAAEAQRKAIMLDKARRA